MRSGDLRAARDIVLRPSEVALPAGCAESECEEAANLAVAPRLEGAVRGDGGVVRIRAGTEFRMSFDIVTYLPPVGPPYARILFVRPCSAACEADEARCAAQAYMAAQ